MLGTGGGWVGLSGTWVCMQKRFGVAVGGRGGYMQECTNSFTHGKGRLTDRQTQHNELTSG